MKLKHHHFLVIVFLFLSSFYFSESCMAQRLPEEVIRFHKDHTENGLIFGSVTFPKEKMKFDMYFLQITYMSSDKKLWRRNSSKIKINPTFLESKHIGELNGGKTYLFAFEKPPGNYSIGWVRLSTLKLGQYVSNDTDVSGFSIPFTVNKGEITYIGEINIDEYSATSPWMITVEDKFERDKNAMKNLQKMVNWDAAVKSELKIIRN